MDAVFKALADPNRRELLDQLFKRDGQTLGELCEYLDMSRFGAMKHLRILEDAQLVVTRRVGREKFHYLNPVPIQRVYDRWVSKYAAGVAKTLSTLKDTLEKR
ncbi:MAG TPA: helix-turn-helix domain-containing protein [Candidatus Baltobacteraceae bacterium]